jgi:pyoverdine/dityrosine biosynthesis protein Dit1
MVIGGTPRKIQETTAPKMTRDDRKRAIEISAFPINRYLETCEYELVFGGLVDNLIGDPSRSDQEKFVSLVSNRLLGNTANRRLASSDAIAMAFERCREQQAPVQLLLPAMPFKDQCPFRTELPASQPDLGEAAFLVRLHCLALAVNQVHKFDCECIVVSDGTAYAPFFDVDKRDAAIYLDQLRLIRDNLNLTKSIHFLDLADLIEMDCKSAAIGNYLPFSKIRSVVRRQLATARSADERIEHAFSVLAYGMRWNLNTRPHVVEDTDRDLWRALRRTVPRSNDSKRLQGLIGQLNQRSIQAALDYASFNLALRFSNVLGRFFPDAIRLTSHPKPGQVAAPRFGATYPWNGVAVASTLEEDGLSFDSITCMEAHSAIRMRLRPVYEYGSNHPICYSK